MWQNPKEAYEWRNLIGRITVCECLPGHYRLSCASKAPKFVSKQESYFCVRSQSRANANVVEEQEEEAQYLPWLARSPDLNIIDPLWVVLEQQVRARLPSSTLCSNWRMFYWRNGQKFH